MLAKLAGVWKFLAFMIASFFGVGYMPIASGTFGSAISFVLIVPVVALYGLAGLLWLVVVSFVLGTLATRKVLQYTEHDPSFVVIDEVCGQAITCIPMVWLAQDMGRPDFNMLCIFYFVSFVLFRLFDITKPLFIGLVDRRMTNAFGVMLDDVLAGVCGAIVWGLLFVAFIYCMFASASGAIVWLTLFVSFICLMFVGVRYAIVWKVLFIAFICLAGWLLIGFLG